MTTKVTTYQIERAKVGTQSFEQIKPTVADSKEAMTLLAARIIENREQGGGFYFRIVKTEREFLSLDTAQAQQ